jgi:hypothetical protein
MARARRSNARPDAAAHPAALERPFLVMPSVQHPGGWYAYQVGGHPAKYFDSEMGARMYAAAHNSSA